MLVQSNSRHSHHKTHHLTILSLPPSPSIEKLHFSSLQQKSNLILIFLLHFWISLNRTFPVRNTIPSLPQINPLLTNGNLPKCWSHYSFNLHSREVAIPLPLKVVTSSTSPTAERPLYSLSSVSRRSSFPHSFLIPLDFIHLRLHRILHGFTHLPSRTLQIQLPAAQQSASSHARKL